MHLYVANGTCKDGFRAVLLYHLITNDRGGMPESAGDDIPHLALRFDRTSKERQSYTRSAKREAQGTRHNAQGHCCESIKTNPYQVRE